MPRSNELSMELKGQIVGMASCGKSARQIGRELGVADTTVGYILRRFKETGTNENLPRPGRPPVLTERDKNHLKTIVKRERFTSLREITNQLPMASRWTLSNTLKESGLKLCAAAKKPKISSINIQGRRKWCRDFVDWSSDEWEKVIWSDESTVELGLSSRKIKVWRNVGERYIPQCLAANNRSGRISVMFWSCFWRSELGPLVALPQGKINSNRYCEILEEDLFPFYTAVKAIQGEEPWFMDDNCKVHESNMTKQFKNELGIRSLRWPSQSPDLNPIENLWKLWKDGIQKASPPPTNREELISAAEKAWDDLRSTHIGQILADSIKKRIEVVKKGKGRPSKY